MLEIKKKYKYLIDLIKFPADAFQYKVKIIAVILDTINNSVFTNRRRCLIKSSIFVDNNLIADIQEYLKPAIAASAKALFILLDYSNKKFWKSPLSIDKYYKSFYSYSRKQLDKNINTLMISITIEYRK